jgi:hypothetical protein
MKWVNETEGLKRGIREIIENRRPVGIHVVGNMKGPIFSYQLYDCVYTDGHSEIRRGQNLRTYYGTQDMNGTKEQIKKSMLSLRPDLEPAMRACQVLLEKISNSCLDLDTPKTKKAKKPRHLRTPIYF